MGFVEWTSTDTGANVTSFVWGLGFAFLFYRQCSGKDCIVIKSPPVADVTARTFSYTGDDAACYRYEAYYVPCTK